MHENQCPRVSVVLTPVACVLVCVPAGHCRWHCVRGSPGHDRQEVPANRCTQRQQCSGRQPSRQPTGHEWWGGCTPGALCCALALRLQEAVSVCAICMRAPAFWHDTTCCVLLCCREPCARQTPKQTPGLATWAPSMIWCSVGPTSAVQVQPTAVFHVAQCHYCLHVLSHPPHVETSRLWFICDRLIEQSLSGLLCMQVATPPCVCGMPVTCR